MSTETAVVIVRMLALGFHTTLICLALVVLVTNRAVGVLATVTIGFAVVGIVNHASSLLKKPPPPTPPPYEPNPDNFVFRPWTDDDEGRKIR